MLILKIRTRVNIFVVMLTYMIPKYISEKTAPLGYTRKFVIESLDKIQYIEYYFEGQIIKRPPDKLNKHQKEI